MRSSHNTSKIIAQRIDDSQISITTMILVVEDLINMHKTTREANDLLEDDIGYITNDFKLSQSQMLLSVLRLSGDSLRSS